jgi:hypothetical protein
MKTFLFVLFFSLMVFAQESPESIIIYMKYPDCPYKEIGTIVARDDDYEQVIEALQKRAIALKGNALVIIYQGKKESGNEDQHVLATVIKINK